MKVIIKRNGEIWYESFEDGSWLLTEENLFSHLRDTIELEEGFTLRNYFELFEKYPLLVLLDEFLPAYIKEYKNCPSSECTSEDLDYLELNRTVARNVWKDGTSDLEWYVGFDGWSEKGYEYYPGSEDKGHYWGIEFMHLDKLLDMELRLGKANIDIYSSDYKLEGSYKANTAFTFYEFLKEPIWELSFIGEPEDRDESWDNLKQIHEDCKSGRIEAKSIDDIFGGNDENT